MEFGLREIDESDGSEAFAGVMVSVAVWVTSGVTPAYEAVIVATVDAVTADVETAKDVFEELAAIVTVGGTLDAWRLLVDSATVAAPAGTPESITVPCEGLPPITLDGFKERDIVMRGGDGDGGVVLHWINNSATATAERQLTAGHNATHLGNRIAASPCSPTTEVA